MNEIMISIIRTSVAFFILLVISLWIGKQVNSKKNPYNFALSITIGSFIANMGFDIDLHFLPMLTALLSMVFIYFIFSLASMKSRRMRLWLSGKPVVVIKNGKILDDALKKIRFSLDDLNQQLREQGIFYVTEVEYALLEVSGNLSVLKKTEFQNATKLDIHPASFNQQQKLPIELIMDGVVIENNLTLQFSSSWLDQQLKMRNIQLSEIQYAVIASNESLFIDLFND